MPALYAHKYFGETVLNALPQPLKNDIALHKEAFVLGTQGPDILFNHKPFSKNAIKQQGMDMHLRSAKDFFEKSAQKVAQAGNQSATSAYVAGFICHFMLDNACHPHIYLLESKGVSHGRIESEFDKYLKRKNGEKVHRNSGKAMHKKNGTSQAAAQILEVDEKSIKRAIKTMRIVNGLFSFPSKLFHKFAHFVLRRMHAENKFGGMFLYFDDLPECDELNPILTDNLQNAVAPTAELIENYFAKIGENAFTGELYNAFDKDYKGESLL